MALHSRRVLIAGEDQNQRTDFGFLSHVDIYAVGLVVVLIVAAVLRFYDLDRTSIWLDEATSWKQARQPFFEMLAATARDNYPPLHNIILHCTIALFGDSETALRVPSALLGVGTVYLLYRVGTLLWDRTTGLIAALLLALSGFHIWYSTEARMYTLLSFTATLFVLTVIQATRRPNWMTSTGCAAAGTALLYSHVYGSFIFLGISLYVSAALLMRASWINVGWRGWIISQAAVVALFLPWADVLLDRADVVQAGFWLPEPTPEVLLKQLSNLAGGKLTALGLFAILSLINVPALRSRFGQSYDAVPRTWLRLDWESGMVLVWLIAPIVIGYVISIASQPIFHGRYLIGALPAWFLLAARVLASLPLRLMAPALTVILLILLPDLRHNLEKTRPDHRTAMREFSKRYEPSDRVIYVGHAQNPSSYYFRQPVPDAKNFASVSEINEDDISGATKFWLIGRRKPPSKEFLAKIETTHKKLYSMPKGGAFVYLFERTLHEGNGWR